MTESFFFYDLETFGRDPRLTRIAQFAAIRTDAALNEIGPAIDFMVQPADDLLPSPGASMVTGIDPAQARRVGLREADAFARIQDAMATPKTCTVGYNSLRFDDEFIRFGLYRNFHDPYEREWRGGNARWDLLDVMRLWHALRPDGLVWPSRADGAPSFKLEDLALANGVRQGDAHEALSDVRALIGLARALHTAQPRLWTYALRLRDKRFAGSLLDVTAPQPTLHVSQRYPASRLCAAPVIALARHPHIDSRVIVFDLGSDPDTLLGLDADAIADRLYTPAADLPPGQSRVPLKEVHLNRCPALVAWPHLTPPDLARLGIDERQALERAARIRAAGPALAETVRQVYARASARTPADADAALYDGFLPEGDRRRMAQVRATAPAALGTQDIGFQDPRLVELLFRYRARNWPEHLDHAEQARWDAYRQQRLAEGSGLSELSLPAFFAEIDACRQTHAGDGARLALLDRLHDYGLSLARSLPHPDTCP